jgi:hypothetical protein
MRDHELSQNYRKFSNLIMDKRERPLHVPPSLRQEQSQAYDILGITVRFPYNAYECQIKLMESVIKSLKSGSNALVESPTGKLLCVYKRYWKDSLSAMFCFSVARSTRSKKAVE